MTPSTLEISNNSTSIFKSCQKKYEWNYIYGLKPIRKSSALSLGSIIHKVFDIYYSGGTKVDGHKYIAEAIDAQINNAAPEEQEDLQIVKYILTGMWLNYDFKLDGFSKIVPELEFKVRVPGTRGILFVGKVDGLVTDLKGSMWVRELKTTAQPFSTFEARCRQSSQATGYIWAMRKLGYPVQGTIYDYVKKPLLRKGVNEDVATYGHRIMTDYQQRPDMYYKRHLSYRTNEEINLFEQDLRQCAYDIRKRSKDNRWYRNTDQCWNYNSECPFLKICFQKTPDPLTVSLYYEQKQTIAKGGSDAATIR